MKVRPRAAFVVTFSVLGIMGCHKDEVQKEGAVQTPDGGAKPFKCEPPDCHMNPPPPTFTPNTNPPAIARQSDAGADAATKPPPPR